MKVDNATLTYIQNVVRTAQIVKINNIIIEPGKVRAIDDEKSVVVFHDENVPPLPFNAIGLNRIGVFMDRFEITKNLKDFELEVIMPDAQPNKPDAPVFARALLMKAKGTKIDYRCANPATIQAPKAINDQIKFKVDMNAEAVVLMSKGQGAMTSDEVTLVSDKDGVRFEMSDINGDTFSYVFAGTAEVVDPKVDPKDVSFSHRYPLKVILPLFKASADSPFFVTTRGMLKVIVNNLDLYVLPRA